MTFVRSVPRSSAHARLACAPLHVLAPPELFSLAFFAKSHCQYLQQSTASRFVYPELVLMILLSGKKVFFLPGVFTLAVYLKFLDQMLLSLIFHSLYFRQLK